MEQNPKPVTAPQNSEADTVRVPKKELEFLRKMVKDTGFLAHHIQSLVLTLVDNLPEKAKNADKMPSGIQIASMIPSLMKHMKDPIAEVIEHFPELKRICEQYSILHDAT
ncbi:MAG: hypothetical protein AAF927_01685 [Bacteroidota bacterium]